MGPELVGVVCAGSSRVSGLSTVRKGAGAFSEHYQGESTSHRTSLCNWVLLELLCTVTASFLPYRQ